MIKESYEQQQKFKLLLGKLLPLLMHLRVLRQLKTDWNLLPFSAIAVLNLQLEMSDGTFQTMVDLEGDTTQSGDLEMCILFSISELVLLEEIARN